MTTSPVAAQRDEVQRDLWTRTAVVAGRLNRAQGELVDIAAELIDGGHWGDGGFRSPDHYLVVRAGLSPAHAKDVVTLARRQSELTDATEGLRAGTLSLDQAAVVAHHAPASYQQSATHLARHATVPQLRRALSLHAFKDAPPSQPDASGSAPSEALPSATESAAERRACAKPELSMHYDRDGRFQLRYNAPATIGALVEQAVKEAKDALFMRQTRGESTGTGQEPAPPAELPTADELPTATWLPTGGELPAADELPTYADALAEIAERALSTVTSKSRASHYRVYLHLSTDGAWLNGGGAIPQRLLRRFLSDGILQPVWETDGRPVSVGRKMRILPARSRRLIEDRDRGCRSPVALRRDSSRSTTWTSGPTAGRPTTTTRSASAPSTTTRSTAGTSTSRVTRREPTASS